MIGIAVAGVTASGKSDLATELAVRYGGEVISCDSMLVYRGCDIGTAKPSEAEKWKTLSLAVPKSVSR